MNLSLHPKKGAIHVRGARLLRVVEAHGVDTSGRDQDVSRYKQEIGYEPPPSSLAVVQAEPGDLVVEVATVRSGTVMAYSYLTGAAVGLIGYSVKPARYEPAEMREAVFPVTPAEEPPEDEVAAFFSSFRAACVAMKIDPDVDAFVLDSTAPDEDTAQTIAAMIIDGYKLLPKGMSDAEAKERQRSHLVGLISVKDRHWFLHLQPPRHASKYTATPFQVGLCISSVKLRKASAS